MKTDYNEIREVYQTPQMSFDSLQSGLIHFVYTPQMSLIALQTLKNNLPHT